MSFAKLTFESGEKSLEVQSFWVHEQISSLFTILVQATTKKADLDLDTILGKAVALQVQPADIRGLVGQPQAWSGVCSQISLTMAETKGLSGYALHIVPNLWLLTLKQNHRIFQHLRIPKIVDKILQEWKIEPKWAIDKAKYPKLEYKVQYGESDYDFISRLLQEAGIAYTFEPADKKGSVLTFCDALEKTKARQQPLYVRGTPSDAKQEPAKKDAAPASEQHWIGVKLQDEDGEPVPNIAYEIKAPEKKDLIKGKTDAQGVGGPHRSIAAGQCKVTFPKLSKDVVRAESSTGKRATKTAGKSTGTAAAGAEKKTSKKQFVWSLSASHEVRPGAFAIRDFDFRRPNFQLHCEATKAKKPEDRYELYYYEPGATLVKRKGAADHPVADQKGGARRSAQHGQQLATRGLEAVRRGREQVAFWTNVVDLRPGVTVTVAGAPVQIGKEKLLIREVTLSGRRNEPWECATEAVFATLPYRPLPDTPKPIVHAVQSATVVGPKGEQIYCDEFGRVRVHFPWDRDSKADDTSSCWLRVANGWAGTGYGMMHLPRIGQPVLVAFLEGDPDQPVVVSRVFDQVNPVPYKLPEKKTLGVLRGHSTPQGDGLNEIHFDDAKDKELFFLQAQKNLRKLVKQDEASTAGHDLHKLVKQNEIDTTGKNRTELTEQHRVELTTKNRLATIGATRNTKIGKDESSRYATASQQFVGGDQDLRVAKERKEHVEKKTSQDVKGKRQIRIGKSQSLTVTGSQAEQVGELSALVADQQIHFKAGTKLIAEAGSEVTFKAPGGFFRIGSDGVTVRGNLVLINSGGAAGSGPGSSPTEPKPAKEAKVKAPPKQLLKVMAKALEAKVPLPRIKQWPEVKKAPKIELKAEAAPKPTERPTSWIRLKVVDDITSKPISGVDLTVKCPDGSSQRLATNDDGVGEIKNIKAGTCTASAAIEGAHFHNTLAFADKGTSPSGKPQPPTIPGKTETSHEGSWSTVILQVKEHRVQAGETLQDVARKASLSAPQVAKFNWGTDEPDEVLAFMKAYVDCAEDFGGKDKSKANPFTAQFTGKEDPGVIYLPRKWELADLATEKTHTIRVRQLQLALKFWYETDTDDDAYADDTVILQTKGEKWRHTLPVKGLKEPEPGWVELIFPRPPLNAQLSMIQDPGKDGDRFYVFEDLTEKQIISFI